MVKLIPSLMCNSVVICYFWNGHVQYTVALLTLVVLFWWLRYEVLYLCGVMWSEILDQ